MRGITNARPKDGVQTINNLAPDGNGNFTIEAGTGVSITAGTNKITIGASGGGETWTELTSGLWSQLIDPNTNNGTLLYDVMIMPKTYTNTIMSSSSKNVRVELSTPVFLPKGMRNMNTSLSLPVRTNVSYWDSAASEYITGAHIYYGFNSVGTTVAFYVNHEVITIDGANNEITISNSVSNSGTRSNTNWTSVFRVYYR